MKTISETEALNELIMATEKQAAYELVLLKQQFQVAKESLKPINLLKESFHEMTTATDSKTNLVGNIIGLGTGFLSKKLLLSHSNSALKRALGTGVELAVAHFVSKHTDDIASLGSNLWKRLWSKNKP